MWQILAQLLMEPFWRASEWFARLIAVCLALALANVARADTPPTASSSAAPASAASSEFFEKDIRPLLAERCFDCHGGKKKVEASLKLTSRADMLHGGDDGPAIVPGKPDDSLLIKAIRYDGDVQMPPKGKLKDAQIKALTRWVEMGAPWTVASATPIELPKGQPYKINDEQRRFWSFQPVRPQSPPTVKDAWLPRSDIDRFILAPLEAKGLSLAPPADRRTLLRRATFDLTGLPPTIDEMDAFLADKSPNAFARVVDRLLASPEYGKRWGRHWLDLVRYADAIDVRWVIDHNPIDIPEAWRYRDWVVDAFNRDLPYDQFLINQLAGDLLPPADKKSEVNVEGTVATGLLALGVWDVGDADKEKTMTDIVDDQIDVVSRSMLGLTVACARCHDHKFDPIPTTDYYGLAGIFFSTHVIPSPGTEGFETFRLYTPLVPAAEVKKHNEQARPIEELKERIKTAPKKEQAGLTKALAQLEAALAPPLPSAHSAVDGGVPGRYDGFHDSHVLIRGSYSRPAEIVPRHFPIILAGEHQPPLGTKSSGRLELARWIASPQNALTARVMVNRIWQHHFGEGIVRTPSNFGKLGLPPTHPELLDYLAARFVESGWSIKAMHRAIMLSAVYQQSSAASTESLRADPENKLCGRTSRQRLEAEEVRDNMLAVTGELDKRHGGPATRDFNSPRSTLYQMSIRSEHGTFLDLFDAANSSGLVDTRTVSTVAPQALFLMNHPFVIDRAKALVERVRRDKSGDEGAKINRLYLLLYGRPVTTPEREIGLRAVREQGWETYCQVLLCSSEFIYVD